MEVSLPLSVSDTLIHISGDQQVISQPAGLPGVIPVQFTDKSDTAGQEVLFYLGSVLHALFASYSEEMETNTVGFVLLQQKAEALNLHGSSHTPSGTC